MIHKRVFLFIFTVASLHAGGIVGTAAEPLPSPALLVTIQGPGEEAIQVVDPSSMKVVANVPLSCNPHEVAISDDGNFAFATCSNSGFRPGISKEAMLDQSNQCIAVIDLVQRKEVKRIDIGPGSWPHGIIFAGGKVYFTAEGYSLIGRYNPAIDRVDWMMGTGQKKSHLLVITKDLNRIFVANVNAGSVSAITSEGSPRIIEGYFYAEWETNAIPIGGVPLGIDMSPDNKEVWVSSKADDGLSIIDVATSKVLQTFKLSVSNPIKLKFTPDGKKVVIPDQNNGDVLVIDAKTRKEIKRISLGEQTQDYKVVKGQAIRNGEVVETENKIQNLTISSDSSRAYLTNSGRNRLAVVDLNTLKLVGNIPIGTSPEHVAWLERK